jgi:hypothetical protein
LIKGILACLLLLTFVFVLHAADDTRFTLKDGIIEDSELGLQWVPATDRTMNHYDAEGYVQALSLAGGGWRLPTRAELKSLYDKYKPGGVDRKFNVSGCWVWASELDGSSSAWYFYFGNGRELSHECHYPYFRVLAVRSRR